MTIIDKSTKKHTQKQLKLLNLISENIGNKGFSKSMYQLMLDAGYSETTAHQQSGTLMSIRGEIDDIANICLKNAETALQRLNLKIDDARYGDLVTAVTKFIELFVKLRSDYLVKENGGVIQVNEESKRMTDEAISSFLNNKK